MNHCITCGHLVSTGRTAHASNNTQCLICIQARVMRDWHYDSPASKRRNELRAAMDALREIEQTRTKV